jgi:acetyl/propionyl-CoA carboxylase alpha subunit
MIAKVIAHGASRSEARERLAQALDATVALGVRRTNRSLAQVLREDSFARGEATTQFLATHRFTGRGRCFNLCDRCGVLAQAGGYGEWTRLEQQTGARHARALW